MLLLREVDKQHQLTQRLATVLDDARDPVLVRHKLQAMIRQRVFGVAAGYEDLNDHETLCALAREDVERNKRYIRRAVPDKGLLKLTKTGQECIVWLAPPALEAVNALLRLSEGQTQETEIIHISRHQTKTVKLTPLVAPIQARNLQIAGRRLKPPPWATKWDKLLNRANVRRRVSYQTRHTYACWSLTAHGNIAYIANQMGHKDYSMLVRVYGRWMDSGSENEAEFIWQELKKSGAFCPKIAPSK